MEDRELCLRLAEALGWERINNQYDDIRVPDGIAPATWLLTPIGAFALLAHIKALDGRTQGGFEVAIHGDGTHQCFDLTPRAIAEATLAALESERV